MHRFIVVLMLASCACSPVGAKSTGVPPTSRARGISELEVSGVTQVVVIDGKGRRTGWEGHKIEEIPGCALEAFGDEHAEPISFRFQWARPVSAVVRLLVTAHLDGEVEIAIQAVGANGKPCGMDTTEAIKARESREWHIRTGVKGAVCGVAMTRVEGK